MKSVIERHGQIDILVNNAGITRDGLLLRMKVEDWDAVMATNLRGAFLASRFAAASMIRSRWGRILNIGSVVGQMGNAGQANYVASKAGLIGLTKSLARELASRRVTVNAIAPGYIETEMTAGLPDEAKQRLFDLIPLGRLGTPSDVAAATLFLASEAAGYITGQVVNVNGGMYM
jgi:3-oxoacyl-[acyl-carrier protein] reductase